MKKRTIYALGIIEFLILFSTLLIFLLSSQKGMEYLVNYATKLYDLKYEKLEGNLLKNITLTDITYKGKILTKIAHIDLNFRSFLKAEIKIDDIMLKDLDLEVLQEMIENQSSNKKNNSSIKSIPTINIVSIFLSTKPYHKYNINIDQLFFIANNIRGNLTDISIDSFSFYSENDHTNITADGEIKEKVLNFSKLWISDIDLQKMQDFYTKFVKNINKTKKLSDNKGIKHLIKSIKVDDFKTNIKPYTYANYNIDSFNIEATQIDTEFEDINVNKIKISSNTNMYKLNSIGKIKKNKLITDVEIKLDDKYFKKFIPFFNFNNIEPIKLSLLLDKDSLNSSINLKSQNILIKESKDINLTIRNAKAIANMKFSPIDLKVQLDANISTKYSKKILASSNLYYNKKDKFFYNGILNIDKLENVDKLLIQLLKNSEINFQGTSKKITATLKNKNLKAKYDSKSYKNATLTTNSEYLILDKFFPNLPKEFQDIKTSFSLVTDIDFKNFKKLDTKIDLNSNALNFKGDLITNNSLEFIGILTLGKNSVLQKIDKNIKLNSILPANIKTTINDKFIQATIKNNIFKSFVKYKLSNKYLDFKLNINNDQFAIGGEIEDKLFIKISTLSLKTFQENFSKFYNFKIIPLDGEVTINAIYNKNKKLHTELKSRWLVYEYSPNLFAFTEKVKFDFDKSAENILLNNYYFSTYLDYDRVFSAKKESKISLKKNKIIIKSLWVNDQAKITGDYDFFKNRANITLKTKDYHYKGKEGDMHFDADIFVKYSKKELDIEGNILSKDTTITYVAKKEHYIQDEDIIIIQEQNKIDDNKKENNITIDLSILTKKPIRYKIEDTDVKFDLDMKFWKERQKKLELLGIARIIKGTHFESEKKFIIQSGEVLFAGDILNPYLNINVKHQNDPYEITININGLLESPILNFSSVPFLTQSDILSILLFSSTTKDLFKSDGDSSKAAISIFGNTFVKEIVENFGIKLDKFVLSTTQDGGFGLEVGKKISKKITVIYINDIVQTIKIKYQHSKRFESDITMSPDSSGIDFLYKNEY